ncbi:MAG TPA: deoxyribodipyrimidine photolyase [Myxococcota bacterium]|nr:deoxyribodipyrimidine photolyase [Myxococcota bacterium]
MPVPASRIRAVNDAPVRPDRDFVLHWMTGVRRIDGNFAIDRAVEHAKALNKPLLVFEALRAGYKWASDRLHAFAIAGMRDNAARLEGTGVGYYCYLEAKHGHARGLLEQLAGHACVITTDDVPTFFLPAMVQAAGAKIDVRLEAIDGNGLLPLRATSKVFERAQDFRRYMQKTVVAELEHTPRVNPLKDTELPAFKHLPKDIAAKWPHGCDLPLERMAIDHDVPVARLEGGSVQGLATAKQFIAKKLGNYGEGRNHPDEGAASGLSPYLHWGFVGVHQIFALLADREEWTPAKVGKANGKRAGFWNMSENDESFLDELITWREVGYNSAALRVDPESYDSLPAWAKTTLAKHASDKREHSYDLETLESAKTYDEVWNAAQNELLREGRMHNYLRMLWGKKILEWSETPRQALETLLHLNNKYALDGRNPNSTSGIFWVFGRYDRPWGPERKIFGTVRYMTSQSTLRKLRMRDYMAKYGR